jgi:hypothetical protein
LQRPARPLSVLASALAAAGLMLAAAGCSNITPLAELGPAKPARSSQVWPREVRWLFLLAG